MLATKLNSDGSNEIPNNFKTKYWAKNGEKRIENCDFFSMEIEGLKCEVGK